MTIEWIPGTIDPRNNLRRTKVTGCWAPSVPMEDGVSREVSRRQLLVEIAERSGSQEFADFISDAFKLKDRIKLDS